MRAEASKPEAVNFGTGFKEESTGVYCLGFRV